MVTASLGTTTVDFDPVKAFLAKVTIFTFSNITFSITYFKYRQSSNDKFVHFKPNQNEKIKIFWEN